VAVDSISGCLSVGETVGVGGSGRVGEGMPPIAFSDVMRMGFVAGIEPQAVTNQVDRNRVSIHRKILFILHF